MEMKSVTYLSASPLIRPTRKDPSSEGYKIGKEETPPEFAKAIPMVSRSNSSNGSSSGASYVWKQHRLSSSSSAERRREGGVSVFMQKRDPEAPCTPGRPLLFRFSPAHPVPSKWDDAEKWLPSSEGKKASFQKIPRKRDALHQKSNTFGERASAASSNGTSKVVLKDKFTESAEICRRDVGTEMTPLGSTSHSRCHTPVKSASPARHNTPASWSGRLAPYSAATGDLKSGLFTAVDLNAQFDSMLIKWGNNREEEDEVSKSPKRFEMNAAGRKSCAEGRSFYEPEEEKNRICLRYQREEAKIHAWVSLESAKAEAEFRKLEVKIQKMRAELEDKLMRKMTNVHKKAEEMRAASRAQHLRQLKSSHENGWKRSKNNSMLETNYDSCRCFTNHPNCDHL